MTIRPLTGKEFYMLVGDGASTEVFTYLCLATSIDSDHSLDVEDAMIGDETDPALPASRQSSVKGATWDITLSGLADPKKLERVNSLHRSGSPGNFQLMKDLPGTAGGNVEKGAFLVTAFKESMSDKGLVKFTITLHGQGAPTVTANT